VTQDDAVLYLLRFLTGAASAAVFVSGGLMAARLGLRVAQPTLGRITPSLVLGLYYGGTGLGIVASALLAPPLVALSGAPAERAGWQWAWVALAAVALLATLVAAPWVQRQGQRDYPLPAHAAGRAGFQARPFALGLAGYFMFGLGYIGYMTFIVTLLREQALSTGVVAAFYTVLGLGVMASPWLWAGLLQRHRNGRALATLNALLAVATVLPVVWVHPVVAFASGTLFGAVFLSVVASTTALVRHNLPQAAWSAGISGFTIVFAAGQIVGPSLVGLLADGPGGLRAGLGVSAAALLCGAALAAWQRALPAPDAEAGVNRP
jgi:predicted MFS family arabinose efflux permease